MRFSHNSLPVLNGKPFSKSGGHTLRRWTHSLFLTLNLAAVSALVSSFILLHSSTTWAATTINSANNYAYGANLGWLDWRGDTNNGAVIGEYVCSGYIYAANVGWIDLGGGAPTNGIQYQNLSTNDFGVNHDGLGNLRGYAYGANIGWVNFENNGAAGVDLLTGRLSGSVYSANCGWISLSNAVAFVQTDSVQLGALAPDGLPVAWLLQNFGTTNVNVNADPDLDGQSNGQEYLAGTDPNSAASLLKITAITRGTPAPASTVINWNAVATRFYAVQARPSLASGAWGNYASQPTLGWNSASFNDFNPTNEFFRVRAYRPLTP
jgi:hypothetical protein